MGASVINLWLGSFFTIFRDRAGFEECLQDTRSASSRRP